MRPLGGFLVAAVVAMLLRSTALSSLAARGLIVDAIAVATVIWALRHGDVPPGRFWFGWHASAWTVEGHAGWTDPRASVGRGGVRPSPRARRTAR